MEDRALVTTNNELSFTPNQIKLIQNTIAKNATADELNLFLYQAHKTGLDPLARQIYFVKRGVGEKAKATIQTSIDGFRIIAERSGQYAGQDEPEFEERDGKIIRATVRVYKFGPNNQRYCAAVGVAYWEEYVPENKKYKDPKTGEWKTANMDAMWQKMPHTMIAKVAESIALRKAFPQDLSGLYTTDEMKQADDKTARVIEEPKPQEDIVVNNGFLYDPNDDFGATNALKEAKEPLTGDKLINDLEHKYGKL